MLSYVKYGILQVFDLGKELCIHIDIIVFLW